MKFGVIADTHLEHGDLPDWVFAAFTGVDRILHAGDIEAAYVLESLEEVAPVSAVRGNVDFLPIDLPLTRLIRVGTRSLVMAHRPEDAWRARTRHTVLLIHGHTHQRVWEQYDGLWVLNPGSPRRPRGGQAPSVAVVEFTPEKIAASFRFPPGTADE